MTAAPSPILELLATERAALAAAVARVPVSLQTRPPAPGHWSVVQVLEHLTRVEVGVARLLVKRGRPGESGPLPEGLGLADLRLTPERIARLRSRVDPIEAPERVRPPGTAEPAAAWQALEAGRAELLRAFAAADPDALDLAVHEHAVLGPLVLRDWVAFVAHHEARHCSQVMQIAHAMESLGPPDGEAWTRTSRVIRARPEALYAAFLDPSALADWLPPAGMTGRIHAFDARVGGGYRMSLYYPPDERVFRGKTAEQEDMVDVRFVELTPPRRIVEAIRFVTNDPVFRGEMTLTVTFDEVPGGTEVTLDFRNLPPGLRPEDNDAGSRMSLEQLAARFEPPQTAGDLLAGNDQPR